jgi:alanine-synthesizing transaminase
MMFSKRTNWLLQPNELTKVYRARREQGLPILDLTESNPTQCGFQYDAHQILNALGDSRALIYEPDPRGLLSARRAVAEYYAERGVHLDPGQIFLTASTSEAYSFTFRLLADAGDNLLVPRPSYPLLDFLTRLNDLELIDYPLVYDGYWQIDRAALLSRITPRTRALLVVHPNNPTGSFISPEETNLLIACCQEHFLALIADEVFSDYAHGSTPGFQQYSFVQEARVLTFTLSGLSKISALPQMKCAWVVVNGPEALRRQALDRMEVIADTFLSLSAPVACALPQLLEIRHQMQPQILRRINSNREYLDSQTGSYSEVCRLKTEGGWYAILRVPAIHSDEEWALRLLQEDGVLVHPGHFYDFSSEGYLVVSLLPTPEIFAEGVRRLLARIASDSR